MNIDDIEAIELDKTKAFNWKIRLYDKHAKTIDEIKVNEANAEEVLLKVTKNWLKGSDAN
jgi:hypothetical protein